MRARRMMVGLAGVGLITGGASLAVLPPAVAAAACDDVPAPYVDWSGCDKTGADLADANLAGANLAGVNLSDAYLVYANLAGANLAGVILTNVNMAGANLAGVNLTGANLTGANLAGVNLAGAAVECGTGGVLGVAIEDSPATLPDGWTVVERTLTVPVIACGEDPSPPPKWLQSYARAGSGQACADGWGPSYAQWPNEGTGGWVCDRSLG